MTHYNGVNCTFTWSQGRQLTSGTKGSASFQYQYNADGLRTRKIVGNLTYDYYWQGSQLAMMTITSGTNVTTLKFYYDAQGVPFYLDYNGTGYFYVTNLQGDVVGIANSNGVVGYYEYDAWGRILTINSASSMEYSALTTNPLRYRGYIYDTETGLYYVSSRYYDPEIGRWINADIPETLTADYENFAQYNLFAYCFNNPVNLSDETGTWPSWVTKLAIGVGAIVIGAAVVAATAATGGAAAAFVGATVAGLKAATISGAVGAAVGAGTSAVSHRISTGSWEGADKAAMDGALNGFADGFMTGGITAGVGMAVGALGKTSSGIQIGKTAKPQYGKINAGYGTPKTNGNTLISIQNNAGKRMFSLDLDSIHAVHMHLPKIFPGKHIPIGAIGSGIYAGVRQW